MIKIELTADNIDFNSLLEALKPYLNDESVKNLGAIKVAAALMPKDTKENYAVELFNSDKLNMKEKAKDLIKKSGVSADIISVTAKKI